MESMRYQKTGIITLFGFIIFSLIVIWLVNVYLTGEKDYKQREIDMQLTKEILLDSEKVNQVLSNMQKNLIIQRNWLEETLKNQTVNPNNFILSKTIYLKGENVSIIDESKIKDTSDYGNLILYGETNKLKPEVQNEINLLGEFFKLEKILQNQLSFDMNSIYYSKNNYVTYYPYVEIGERKVNYQNLFLNVDAFIEKININSEDKDFDPTLGWDRAYIDESTSKNLIFSTIMPVAVDDEIKGILTGTLNATVFNGLFTNNNEKVNIYLTDANNSIIYTNNKDIVALSDISDVFLERYKVKYYQNKFPTPLEIRQEKKHTLYISELERDNWYLTYVIDNKIYLSNTKIILYNILMFLMLGGTIYLYIKFAKKKKNNIESIINISKHDGMTELLNHKHIIETLKKYLRQVRIKQLSIMMLDIDDFKSINDNLGHSIGDQVIRVSAKVIKSFLDEKNSACGRYGGDEFLILIPRISEQNALELAEQIRVAINEAIYEEMGINVTVSIGLYYVIKPIESSAAELVNEADKNLYMAKKSGKNQVYYL